MSRVISPRKLAFTSNIRNSLNMLIQMVEIHPDKYDLHDQIGKFTCGYRKFFK